MKPVLTVKKMCQNLDLKSAKDKRVLNNVGFEIPQGSVTGFVGSNGSGKTTTLKTILGFLPPISGEILFFGSLGLSSESKQKIGFMPERPYFYEYLSAHEFLGLHWELRGYSQGSLFRERVKEVLSSVGLENIESKRLRQFSKGMLQRLGIAQAILHKPDFLILDEPMSGLDPEGRVLIKSIIKQLNKNGTTIFFSSHLLQDMEELCDRLIVIDHGEIIFEGLLKQFLPIKNRTLEISWIEGELENEKEELKIEVVSENELQGRIDQLRKDKRKIIQIQKTKMNLEMAFSEIKSNRQEKLHVQKT